MRWSAPALLLLSVVGHHPRRPRLAFRTVSAGASHTCRVAAGGAAYCWGDNTAGELGTGDGRSHARPAAVTGDLVFASLSAGDGFTCGVTASGVVYCWGRNPHGQLGSRAPQRSETPLPVISAGPVFLQVSAGRGYACGIGADHAAYCWGGNDDGQLGTGDTARSTRPLAVAGRLSFDSVSAGWSHTCAVTPGGTAYCWGSNAAGQLGNGTTVASRVPVAVAHIHDFVSVSAGARHTCGLTARGLVYCWGDDFLHQLRPTLATGVGSWVPLETGVRGRLVSVTAGAFHTCTLSRESIYRLTCWGSNQESQLGVNDTLPGRTVSSREIFGGIPIVQVDAGDAHTCGVTEDGAVYCWGRNDDGELGDGSLHLPVRPARVAEPDSMRD
jgi:alpha-tubulin suppressor-like RCC1 family protein